MTGANGRTFTDVTAATCVAREGDDDVLGTSLEGTSIDETSAADSGAETLGQLPQLTVADVTPGEDAAWAALATTNAIRDIDDTLSSVAISGVPSGWSLSGDGPAGITGGTSTAESGDLGGLTLVAPSAEAKAVTPPVTVGAAAEVPSLTLKASDGDSASAGQAIAASGIGGGADTSSSPPPPVSGTPSSAAVNEAVAVTSIVRSGGAGSAALAKSDLGRPVMTASDNDAAGDTLAQTSSDAVAVTTIFFPTVAIEGPPVEGTTLTASVIVADGFTGTTEFLWQRFYAGQWWDIPIEPSPYSSSEVLTFVTTPTYVVREEDENVSAIRVEVNLVDATGLTVATADSPSIGPVLDQPATLSLSPISGSPVQGATLTVSAQVVTDEGTFTPVIHWQRFYAGGWWDIPIELMPYSSNEVFTFVTTPAYVVRAEDANVLAIRAEATYIDDTGRTFTIVDGAETISEPPQLTAANVTLGENTASVALAIAVATHDTDYTLGGVTISGVPSGWALSGDGAVSIADGTWTVAPGDLGDLVLVAPSAEAETFTLSVTAIETALGPTGTQTATATTSFVVTVIDVAEPPAFGATTSWSGSEEGAITLSGLSATGDPDDTLSATLSGISAGWTVRDGETALTNGQAFAAADLGSLVVTSPDGGGETATLTLTVRSSEGSSTATGSELLTVVASGVAEPPTFGTTTAWSGGESVTLSGLSATGDSDDTLSATFTGLSLNWTLVDTRSNSAFTGTSITMVPVSDLGSLVVVASGSPPPPPAASTSPAAPTSATDLLTLTINSSEGNTTASGSETLSVTATARAEPPHFSGPTTFYGGTSVTLSSLGASAVGGDTIGPDVTITGLSANWTLVDTHSGSSFTVASITAIPVSDLGSLVVIPPTGTSYSVTDVLTLTVPSSLGASTTSGSETLSLIAQKYTSLSGNQTGDNLTNADLSGADLRMVNFTGATLTGATLTNADLTGATLTNANLVGADLSGATLHNATGGGADLRGADLVGANLHNTDLTSATLTGADLAGATVHNANLTDATLIGADLIGADFSAATLTGAIFPLQLSLLGASASGLDVTGDVTDGFTGAVTITAVDNAITLGSIAISYSSTAASEAWSISNVAVVSGDTITVTARDSEGAFYSASQTVVATLPAGVAGSPINLALTDPAGGAAIAVAIAGIPEGWSLNAGSDLGNGTWTVETSDPSALAISPAGGFTGAVVLPVTESWIKPDGSSASQYVSDNVEAYAPGNPIFALSSADTLTGSSANDLFVFARPIGNDRIYDFKTASNRIDLIGFSGIASFADLQSKMANDANGDAMLTLGSGETITIVGVDAASLGAANFLFNEEPTTNNPGTMAIGDGAILPLGGSVDNSGTIALNSAGDKTELVLSGGVTLEGGGAVTLSDNTGNAIVGNGAATTLTNLDNTITGAGRLGDDAMTLSNAGVIDATGVNPLIIDTGGNSISNSGTIEATGAGGLVIGGAVANSGTLSADGGNLTVDGTVTRGGTALIAGTATLEFGAASAENTRFASGAAGTLRLDQSAAFSGTVSGFAGGDAIDLADLAFGSNTALSYTDNGAGGGVVTVGNGMQVVDLALLGQYAAAGFQAHSDPGGGTLITYTLQTSSTDAASLTNLGH